MVTSSGSQVGDRGIRGRYSPEPESVTEESLVAVSDQQAYRRYQTQQAIENLLDSAVEYTSDYRRYVILSYLYVRSRLGVPGRSYESEYSGMLPLGGPAHCDVMDLDRWLEAEDSDKLRRDVMDWMLDASPEQVAYYRGLSRIPKSNLSERRSRIAKRASNFAQNPNVQK